MSAAALVVAACSSGTGSKDTVPDTFTIVNPNAVPVAAFVVSGRGFQIVDIEPVISDGKADSNRVPAGATKTGVTAQGYQEGDSAYLLVYAHDGTAYTFRDARFHTNVELIRKKKRLEVAPL